MESTNEYRLTILDRDGEDHEYNFFADHPWEITTYVIRKMTKDGDFYGHNHMETIGIQVDELVKGTLKADVIDLRVTTR